MATFIKIGNGILNKINNSEITQADDFSYLILNGYGEALHYANASFYDIIDCQKSLMSDFKIQMIVLLSLGAFVLCLCMVIIIPFYISIFKIENELWNSVRKNAYDCYFDLKQIILERLRDVHSQPEIALNDRHISKNPYPFKSYWKYIWRVLIYMAAVLLFSIINITTLYEKCTDYLVYRPELLKNLINLQILYTSLSIWTNEVAMEGYGVLMAYQFPTAYPFENSVTIFNEIISKIKYSTSVIKKNKYSSFVSEDFDKILYEKSTDFNADIFRLGVFMAKENIINEAYLIANDFASSDIWTSLMSALQELDVRYDIFIDEIDKYSKSVIDDQMQIIVMNLALFIFFSLAFYLGFYLVFFWSEKKYLKRIYSVMEIIP
ncbi:unnamed protein product [Blepharisma stoltei]|uniref:Odorant receptor n=1 Tax=Blepharisma stoltei TaxID=1481888 RepID=A0AAU9IAB1_9CILI|nr:unnamed protein product [Blepharisma stoltei]